jgi:hypothetical protein
METWLQTVQFSSGKAGKPRAVHLRRVDYERTAEDGVPARRVHGIGRVTLCNAGSGRLAPVRAPATCRQCLRIAAPVQGNGEQ